MSSPAIECKKEKKNSTSPFAATVFLYHSAKAPPYLKKSPHSPQAAEIPLHEFSAAEEPEQSTEGQERAKRDSHAGAVPCQGDAGESSDGTDNGGREEREEHSLPAEEGSDTGDEFYIAKAHGFPGNHDRFHFAIQALELIQGPAA